MGKLNIEKIDQEMTESPETTFPIVQNETSVAESVISKALNKQIEPGVIREIGGAGVDVALAGACPPLAIASIAIKAVAEIVPAVCSTVQNIRIAEETTKQTESISNARIRLAEEKTKQIFIQETEKTKRAFIEAASRIRQKEAELIELEKNMEQKRFEIMNNRDAYNSSLDKLGVVIDKIIAVIEELQKTGVSENADVILRCFQHLTTLTQQVVEAYGKFQSIPVGG